MKFTLVLAVAGLVAAQDFSGEPSCAVSRRLPKASTKNWGLLFVIGPQLIINPDGGHVDFEVSCKMVGLPG
jgi:hypothetical protein